MANGEDSANDDMPSENEQADQDSEAADESREEKKYDEGDAAEASDDSFTEGE